MSKAYQFVSSITVTYSPVHFIKYTEKNVLYKPLSTIFFSCCRVTYSKFGQCTFQYEIKRVYVSPDVPTASNTDSWHNELFHLPRYCKCIPNGSTAGSETTDPNMFTLLLCLLVTVWGHFLNMIA